VTTNREAILRQADEHAQRGGSPGGETGVGRRCRVHQLAERFVREPELILACLEGIEHASAEQVQLVLGAAREAIRAQPRYADLLYHAAQAAVSAGEVETAACLLSESLEINPRYKDALILAARVARARQAPWQAEDYLQRALAAGADYPDVHVLLGDVCREQGEGSRARDAYRRALQLNGDLAAARAGLDALRSVASGGKNDELHA
jgi:tetratricopeptide (TPR) repeat protein